MSDSDCELGFSVESGKLRGGDSYGYGKLAEDLFTCGRYVAIAQFAVLLVFLIVGVVLLCTKNDYHTVGIVFTSVSGSILACCECYACMMSRKW